MDRRSALKNTGLVGILAAGAAPAVHAQATVRWRLATSFPKALEILHGSAVKFSDTVKALSGGKFEVSVHAAGELVPAFGIVDALKSDSLEMGETASYYYTGIDPSFAFSCAIPFGFTAQQNIAWKRHGNGHKLLDELFAKYNFHARSAVNSGTQMGGWYRKEINSPADFKGLKMRLGGGVFGESMAKLGVVAQNFPVGEVYQALEKGALDAVEFVGPYDDEKLGFNRVAKYYYYGAWWEGGADLEFFINNKAFAKLSPEYQAIVNAAMDVTYNDSTSKYLAYSPNPLKRLAASGTQIKRFDKAIVQAGFKAATEVYDEHCAKDAQFKKIYEDLRAFQRDQILWNRVSEMVFTQDMAGLKI